jgi:hypothetical protein
MKKRMTLLLLFGAASAAVISLAQSTPGENKPLANDELLALRSEVGVLRAQIQGLEERTKKLESTVEKLNQPPHLMPLNAPQPNPLWRKSPSADSRPPTIWGEKQVNGWTFYIVPCEQRDK